MELTILMPCLNEAETLAICIRKARAFIAASGVLGEVLISDNGSTDGSQDIAQEEGARLVPIMTRGYGAALQGGIKAAKGKYIIMGDADNSYDFSALMPFLERLRAGVDIVMGNRFKGGIEKRAMPVLHRYLGNPVLSFLGRLFFRIKVGDFHCGLRGFDRERVLALNLRTTGMEFASELVVKSALAKYSIDEVPTILRPDGRSRAPHLRTWHDGWRHLSFLLMYSPRWLFFYPGLFLVTCGVILSAALLPGQIMIQGVGFDIHTLIVACFGVLMGVQALGFALVARRFATSHNLIPTSQKYSGLMNWLTLERTLLGAAALIFAGFTGLAWSVAHWASTGFGPLGYSDLLRVLIISMTVFAIGVQVGLTAFLSAITEVPTR